MDSKKRIKKKKFSWSTQTLECCQAPRLVLMLLRCQSGSVSPLTGHFLSISAVKAGRKEVQSVREITVLTDLGVVFIPLHMLQGFINPF